MAEQSSDDSDDTETPVDERWSELPTEPIDTGDENTTTSLHTRWEYLASVVTGLYLLSVATIVGLAGYGYLSLELIPQGWFVLYSTIALMAATWLFGAATLKAVRQKL